MKLAKVVIASALVLAACAEGLPEGKGFVLKCTPDVKLVQVWYTLRDYFDYLHHLVCCTKVATSVRLLTVLYL